MRVLHSLRRTLISTLENVALNPLTTPQIANAAKRAIGYLRDLDGLERATHLQTYIESTMQ